MDNEDKVPPGSYRFTTRSTSPIPIYGGADRPDRLAGVGGRRVRWRRRKSGFNTADVERYPADGVTPPGAGASQVPTNRGEATFAIGGGAQCAAPCADLARASIGPDVWLSSALQRAGQISGVRAFFYTGPRVTTGETAGPATMPIPYTHELARYAQILASSPDTRVRLHLAGRARWSPLQRGDRGDVPVGVRRLPAGYPLCWGRRRTGMPRNNRLPDRLLRVSLRRIGRGGTGDRPGRHRDVDSAQLAWLEGQLKNAKERR